MKLVLINLILSETYRKISFHAILEEKYLFMIIYVTRVCELVQIFSRSFFSSRSNYKQVEQEVRKYLYIGRFTICTTFLNGKK